MITEEYLMKRLREWARSPEGKKEIKKQTGIDYVDRSPSQQFKVYGEQMRQILFAHINPIIKSITLNDIIVGTPYKGEDGKYRVDISFREDALHRESLNPGRFPDGVHNIVLLFTKGYHAGNYVYGEWKNSSRPGDTIRSKISRPANDFLSRAVAEFNSKNGKRSIVAMLDEKYK